MGPARAARTVEVHGEAARGAALQDHLRRVAEAELEETRNSRIENVRARKVEPARRIVPPRRRKGRAVAVVHVNRGRVAKGRHGAVVGEHAVAAAVHAWATRRRPRLRRADRRLCAALAVGDGHAPAAPLHLNDPRGRARTDAGATVKSTGRTIEAHGGRVSKEFEREAVGGGAEGGGVAECGGPEGAGERD